MKEHEPSKNLEHWPLDRLIPYARNPRKNDQAVEKIASAIREYGFRVPILAKSDGTLIDGHLRLKAAHKLGLETVPVLLADDMTETQIKAFRISVNRMSELAEWDTELLALEIEDLKLEEFDIDLIGFNAGELEILFDEDQKGETQGDTEPQVDRAEELREKWGVETGQLWQLGEHRILCGDSTKAEDVGRVMGGEKAQLCHADPPYGMGKENDGVENDNLYREQLDAFQMAWWKACRPSLDDNASAYIWGNSEGLWRLWFVGGLKDSERLTLRSEIVWDKQCEGNTTLRVCGFNTETDRKFTDSERCLFFMLGEQGFNNNSDNYWEGWEPIRSYLAAECNKMGWTAKDIKRICGVSMYSHWFTKSQWMPIPEEHYQKLKAAAKHDAFKREHDAFKREHDELKREHDELKREFYATRAYFDNTHDNMTDVWSFGRVTGEDRQGHATPKPVDMIARAVKSSSQKGGIVFEPFSGSGTTIIACENLGRKCRAIEISPGYVAVALQRWADHTGKVPVLITDRQ